MKTNKIIGLIGGMGPYSSAYFYKLLLDKSGMYNTTRNDDYPEILIDSVPVPDFISDTTQLELATVMLVDRVKRLNAFGCTRLAMVCNTGHILHPKLQKNSSAEFISLIEEVSKHTVELNLKKVGLFATRTTIESGLYQRALAVRGVEVVFPNDDTIKIHETIIRDVISNGETKKYHSELLKVTQRFIQDFSLDGVILGCTELPLVFPKDSSSTIIDCLEVLANSLLKDYYQAD